MKTPESTAPFPLGGCAVDNIMGVWRFELGPRQGNRWRALPGHVIHCTCRGRYTVAIDGREYRVAPGDVLCFHEGEDTRWFGAEGGLVFYSVHFLARRLGPPPPARRKFRAPPPLRREFARLHEASLLEPGFRRSALLYASLLRIVGYVYGPETGTTASAGAGADWACVEALLRGGRLYRAPLNELARKTGMSRSALVRLCKRATGKAPGRRLRELRIEEAKGLLLYASMNVTAVAESLGYARVHEFSRDFARCVGLPPTEFVSRAR